MWRMVCSARTCLLPADDQRAVAEFHHPNALAAVDVAGIGKKPPVASPLVSMPRNDPALNVALLRRAPISSLCAGVPIAAAADFPRRLASVAPSATATMPGTL